MMMSKKASFPMRAAIWVAGLVLSPLVSAPVVALAQSENAPAVVMEQDRSFDLIDHNLCFKTKKPDLKVRGEIDLYTPQFGFFMGCTIWETYMACAPANKEVVELETKKKGQKKQSTEPLPLGAPEALGNFDSVCYRLACDKNAPDATLLDQFGTRTIKKVKPLLLCNPAVKVCKDPGRPNYVGACSELNGDQEACAQAWQATQDGLASSCNYDSGFCHPCGPGLVKASYAVTDNTVVDGPTSCPNTCVTCAQSDLVQETGFEACRTFDGNQEACESHWTVGDYGPASCFYGEDTICRGCGPANELAGNCSNQCRG